MGLKGCVRVKCLRGFINKQVEEAENIKEEYFAFSVYISIGYGCNPCIFHVFLRLIVIVIQDCGITRRRMSWEYFHKVYNT